MKIKAITSSLTIKQSFKIKRFKDSKAPCTVTHHIHFNDGSGYEAIVDFTSPNGFNEDAIIEAINACIQSVKNATCISVEFISILPYEDKPRNDYRRIIPAPILPLDNNQN